MIIMHIAALYTIYQLGRSGAGNGWKCRPASLTEAPKISFLEVCGSVRLDESWLHDTTSCIQWVGKPVALIAILLLLLLKALL